MRTLIAVVIMAGIAALVLSAGCTAFSQGKAPDSGAVNPGGGSGGGSGGVGGGSGGGSGTAHGGSSGSYQQNIYFSFDCKGAWKAKGSEGGPPSNHHGTFQVEGNIPFVLNYDPAKVGVDTAYYTDVNTPQALPNPLHTTGESWQCVASGNGCQNCHFIFDGEIPAGGKIVYDKARKWTVSFFGGGSALKINSVRQTEPGCPLMETEKYGSLEITIPTVACFSEGNSAETPFTFSDGSLVVIEPHQGIDEDLTSIDPNVYFHNGRAPS